MNARNEIETLVSDERVVLFMKGTRSAPQCGFSARVVDILDEYLHEYTTVDVLADPRLREAIKSFSNWPTLPQLYVDASLVGGSDIVHEMLSSGELAKILGTEAIEVHEPVVTLSPSAAAAFLRFWEEDGDTEFPIVRLTVGSDFEPLLDLDQIREGDLVQDKTALKIVMTRSTARRADGLTVDFVERGGQMGFKVENPNRPPMVNQLPVEDLKTMIDSGKPMLLVDVRTVPERAKAKLEGSVLLDDNFRRSLEGLDRKKTLVFYCHHGWRSQRAADHCLSIGFTDVHNVQGGIEAWSLRIDSSIARY